MDYKKKYYPESQIGGFSNVDGTIAFFSHVNAILKPTSIVVDVGCGRGAYMEDPIEFRLNLRKLRGKCARVIGIDIDPAAVNNSNIDEFRLIQNDHWPVDAGCADIVLCDYVLEHVANPPIFFGEANRILKQAGIICIRTSNLFSYFGLIAKMVPNRKHVGVLRFAKEHADEKDTFPTYYRCNTTFKLRKYLSRFGFLPIVYGYDAEPAYLSFSRFAYSLGVLHQRFMPGIFKAGIHAFGEKK
jgi:SAM-dependent methyltransferase